MNTDVVKAPATFIHSFGIGNERLYLLLLEGHRADARPAYRDRPT